MSRQKERIVVKIGTSTLTYETGNLNLRRFEHIVKVLSDIKNSGVDVIVVTSGAIAVGAGVMKLEQKPRDIPTRQACAAIGQCKLIHVYDRLFAVHNHTVAQLLLTRDVVEDNLPKQRVTDALERLLQMGVIPIINENDTVSVEELEIKENNTFGDNDKLSAMVAVLAGATRLIILSDIDGLYDKNPKDHDDAKLIHVVDEITDEIKSMAEGAGSNRGTGGMASKLVAAQLALENLVEVDIINGEHSTNLYKLLEGEEIGTRFLPKGDDLQ